MTATILVVGGLNGFIGSNTTEALVQQGHDCVVTRHKQTEVPRFLEKYNGHHVFIAQADATRVDDLRRIGEKYKIDGIVNVAGGFKSDGPVPGLKGYLDMLSATFQVAQEWKVKRALMSSTGGVYLGLQGPVNEDRPISLPSPRPIIAYQKIVEVSMAEFARATGISSVCVRLTGMFGPFQDPASYSLVPRLVHAAVDGKLPNLENVFLANADDEAGLLYIKDMARAIALLQTAEKLNHDVYNVGPSKRIPNRELLEAIGKAVPNFRADLPPGRSPFSMPSMDTERLRTDTDFTPKFDTRAAIQDYVGWLKAGNPK